MRKPAATPATLATARYLVPLDPTNHLEVAQRASLGRRAITPGNDNIVILVAQACRLRTGIHDCTRTEDLEHARLDYQGLMAGFIRLATDDIRSFPSVSRIALG